MENIEAAMKRIPPHSTEAEQAVLGAMLMNKDAITVTSEILAGQDFTDGNDIYSFTPQTLKGNRVKISEKLASYLVKYFKDSGLGITTSNYTDYFGSYYLDTDYNRHQLSIVLYIGSGILAFAAIMLFISGNRNGAFIKRKVLR